ncbi:MAG: hypothetical protein WC299_04720 [Kiritimatiellia bacterium]
MKKTFVWFGAWIMATACLFADPIPFGTRELALNGQWNKAGGDGSTFLFEGAFGYFILDNTEIGIAAALARSDSFKALNAGVFGEYHLDTSFRLVPFLGIALKYQRADITETTKMERETVLDTLIINNASGEDNEEESSGAEEGGEQEDNADAPQITRTTTSTTSVTETTTETTKDAAVLELKVGLEYFITKNFAVSLAYVYALASGNVFYDGSDVTSSDQRVQLGLRYFF